VSTAAVRELVDQHRRQQLGLPPRNDGHGYESRYKHGCRCSSCTNAANEARNARRAQEREQRTCRRCQTVFRWPGLLDHHHSTHPCGRTT